MNFVKYKDCYVRAGLGVDKQMVSQCQDNYRNFDDLDGAVVMDWGMNIGAFGVMMSSYPIKQYIGVEPHPENFEVAVKNLNGRENFTLINAAVTTAEVETLNLCLTKSKQNLCSGATNIKSNGARGMRTVVIPVKAINAVDLLDKYQPTHLKCDIEGEEYRIFGDLDWKIPACIKQLALEYHWQDKVLAYESFRKRLTEQGFTPVYEELNYIKGTTEVDFLGKKVNYRNIWGLDCLYKR
jgi:FkbM family methyltransferase